MSVKDEIQEVLKEGVENIISDCKVFQYSKQQSLSWHKHHGGGNFTITIALLASLSLLMKVTCLLAGKTRYYEKAGLQQQQKKVKESFPELSKYFYPRRAGEINESDCFKSFVDYVQSEFDIRICFRGYILTGNPYHDTSIEQMNQSRIEDADLNKVWSYFRNHLMHMAQPKGGNSVTVYEAGVGNSYLVKQNNHMGSFFKKNNGEYNLLVDHLHEQLCQIYDKVVEYIKEDKYGPKDLKICQKWLKLNQ